MKDLFCKPPRFLNNWVRNGRVIPHCVRRLSPMLADRPDGWGGMPEFGSQGMDGGTRTAMVEGNAGDGTVALHGSVEDAGMRPRHCLVRVRRPRS